MAAILAAILDFSNCSRNWACYPADIHYGGPKAHESIEKKTLTLGAQYSAVAAWLVVFDLFSFDLPSDCHPLPPYLSLLTVSETGKRPS